MLRKDYESDSTDAKEKYHAGRSKWGKYKKREKEAKKLKDEM